MFIVNYNARSSNSEIILLSHIRLKCEPLMSSQIWIYLHLSKYWFLLFSLWIITIITSSLWCVNDLKYQMQQSQNIQAYSLWLQSVHGFCWRKRRRKLFFFIKRPFFCSFHTLFIKRSMYDHYTNAPKIFSG